MELEPTYPASHLTDVSLFEGSVVSAVQYVS